jgi:hypothetical protein
MKIGPLIAAAVPVLGVIAYRALHGPERREG